MGKSRRSSSTKIQQPQQVQQLIEPTNPLAQRLRSRYAPWIFLGLLLVGFVIGTVVPVPSIRQAIRDWRDQWADKAAQMENELEAEQYVKMIDHPRVFELLREAIVREEGGFVHPDLGYVAPAPSGAVRGIGMLYDDYYQCQKQCFPGKSYSFRNMTVPERKEYGFPQEDLLIAVPLSYQMTRSVALDVLLSRVPADVQRRASLHELDDAALLVLLIAHERGVGRYSRWMPYIATLPPEPTCGYSKKMRPYMMDMILALREDYNVDVTGWEREIVKATEYSEKIVEGLTRDYGEYLLSPKGVSPEQNIRWALCQVASRATAGNEDLGGLRMIPMLDLINHDANAGGFVELKGSERVEDGDLLDAHESDKGTFVVRSTRHGKRNRLKRGQELLVNYNVPQYTALDWFISLGFVPPERWLPWVKVEPALPRLRADLVQDSVPTEQRWKEQGPALLQELKKSEL